MFPLLSVSFHKGLLRVGLPAMVGCYSFSSIRQFFKAVVVSLSISLSSYFFFFNSKCLSHSLLLTHPLGGTHLNRHLLSV